MQIRGVKIKLPDKKSPPEHKKPAPTTGHARPSDKPLDKSLDKPVVRQIHIAINPSQVWNKYAVYILIGLLLLFSLSSSWGGGQKESIPISQFISDVKNDQVKTVEVAGDELRITYKEGDVVKTSRKETIQPVVTMLTSAGVDVTKSGLTITNMSFWRMMVELLPNLLLVGLMVGAFLFVMRQARGAQDGIMGFGRSKARVFIRGKQTTKFADVGGMEEAKKELEEIVDFLKNPKKYTKLGARTPKGVLLVGPAGTGKTLLARAVAGEANVQFLSIAGSEFMEMLVGVGASRARDLFSTAKKLAPSIIFIDEIDAIGRVRGMGSMGGHDEREQTLNQILVEMDGFTPNDNVIVMAATNRSDMLDPALVRPGRFDRRVTLNLPDLAERTNILSIHAKGKPFAQTVNWERVARSTVGFSGADLENMLNESAISAARENRAEIISHDIDEAALKVKLGPSKKRLQDKHERLMTAYHEAGHALVAHFSPHADPVSRISIVSRGRALGFTLTPPEQDKFQTTKSELMDTLALLFGGRAAERLVFDELTAGASSDIERATRIARAMVIEYGMSHLGPMNFSPLYEVSDYSKAWGEASKISDQLQLKVDNEIQAILNEGQDRAEKILAKHRKLLDKVSEELVDKETLDGEEFAQIMGVEKVRK